MKTLNNHIILYDADCPMCGLYTKAFTKTGMLEAGGRTAYQTMPADICPLVDRQRAVNEIALVNTQTGEVNYGIASLFKVIGNSFILLKPLFGFKPFIWLMSKVYAFISYNRKVIIPGAKDDFEIKPTFRLRYRLAYLLFTWALVGYILTQYAQLLTGMVPVGNAYREYLICGGQIVFQGLVVSLYANTKKWDYLGNMMTISIAGALTLLPGLLVAQCITLPAIAYTFYLWR
jgi:hypothetical protein